MKKEEEKERERERNIIPRPSRAIGLALSLRSDKNFIA